MATFDATYSSVFHEPQQPSTSYVAVETAPLTTAERSKRYRRKKASEQQGSPQRTLDTPLDGTRRDPSEISLAGSPMPKAVCVSEEPCSSQDTATIEVSRAAVSSIERSSTYRQKQRELKRLPQSASTPSARPVSSHSSKGGRPRKTVHATQVFADTFLNHEYGISCSVCDRLWFTRDVRSATELHRHILEQIGVSFENALLCSTCRRTIARGGIPLMAVYNGFRYPPKPDNLPELNAISTRLISPRIPFMQIRRLRREEGSYRILGQIVNIPVDVPTMVYTLPRKLDADHALNVSLKRHLMHKSTAYSGQVKLSTLRAWLEYLQNSTLYRRHKITVDWTHFDSSLECHQEELEVVGKDDSHELLLAQQQTILWSEDKYLCIAPGQNAMPTSIIYDEDAEELSFPAIYYGEPRVFLKKVTPFMIATSEIRRSDRRGATPEHLLYVAMKLLRLRVSAALYASFRCVTRPGEITRELLQDQAFLQKYMQNNLAFLKTVPNSAQYWQQRKRELFSMLRQLGKPTFFLTMSANEMNWPHLLSQLYKIREGKTLSDPLQNLSYAQRAFLINEDSVTVCIYFQKMVSVIMTILQSATSSPFAPHRVIDYFLRVEFQHRGSPHVHILLWLDNIAKEPISEGMPATVTLIDSLCTADVNLIEDSAYRSQQVHAHTPTCYKYTAKSNVQDTPLCRFGIPYWPSRETRVLLPLDKNHVQRSQLRKQGMKMKKALSVQAFTSIDHFLIEFSVGYDAYLNVIRACIKRPTVLFKREISSCLVNTFNPWISSVLKSNTDLQFILDEYSCAAYVVEYVNKTNRGLSNLHKHLAELQTDYPDEDFTQSLKRLSLRMLDSVEMTSQEAAWYLLRQPMSKASRDFVFIAATAPNERARRTKSRVEMDSENLPMDSTDVWTENIFDKYEKRPQSLSHVCLADFAAKFNVSGRRLDSDGCHIYVERSQPRILSYTTYETSDVVNIKRSLVLLFLPYRNEKIDLLDNDKFLELYNHNKDSILQRKAAYESYMDVEQVLAVDYDFTEDEILSQDDVQRATYDDSELLHIHNDDIRNIESTSNALPAIVKTSSGIMSAEEYCIAMRQTNFEQRALIKHCIARIFDPSIPPIQIFLTGPAGCGKTFTLRLLMETYNRFARPHGSNINAYVAAASTGKAAVAIAGTTVHSAFHICALKRHGGLSFEMLQSYQSAFANVRMIIIDECSMIGSGLFHTINERLKHITHEHEIPFGGFDIIFCGDLRQLPPVKASPIYEPLKKGLHRSVLWQSLEFYPLQTVMRQSDVQFSGILTKIGNGQTLTQGEKKVIESRFRTSEWCDKNVKNATRLFHKNHSVDVYNRAQITGGIHSIARDTYSGYQDQSQHTNARAAVHKKTMSETGNLGYDLALGLQYPYMITCNIDVEDGLVNGAIGILKYIETVPVEASSSHAADNPPSVHCVWLEFTEHKRIGQVTRSKIRHKVVVNKDLDPNWTPIFKRKVQFTAQHKVKCQRENFPLTVACAMTTHKSQGATFDKVVFEYTRSLQQQLVYVALSRVKTLDGLFLTNSKNDFTFYHAKPLPSPTLISLQTELRRLEGYKMRTLDHEILEKLRNNDNVLLSFNVQSLRAHACDLLSDSALMTATVLCLSETWMENASCVDLNGFQVIAQNKRSNRVGGVAIYMRCSLPDECYRITQPLLNEDDVGDVCGVIVNINQVDVNIITIYINPNTPLSAITTFLLEKLRFFVVSNGPTPLVVTGDFNYDVKTDSDNNALLDFMNREFQLLLVNDPQRSTTRSSSCIDLVFMRGMGAAECFTHISYFSYHKPVIVSLS